MSGVCSVQESFLSQAYRQCQGYLNWKVKLVFFSRKTSLGRLARRGRPAWWAGAFRWIIQACSSKSHPPQSQKHLRRLVNVWARFTGQVMDVNSNFLRRRGRGFVWPFGKSWESLFGMFPQGRNYWVTNPLAHRRGSNSASQQHRKRKYSSIHLPSTYTIAKVLNAVLSIRPHGLWENRLLCNS